MKLTATVFLPRSWPPGDFHAFGLKIPGGTVVHLTIDISLSFCIIVLYGTVFIELSTMHFCRKTAAEYTLSKRRML